MRNSSLAEYMLGIYSQADLSQKKQNISCLQRIYGLPAEFYLSLMPWGGGGGGGGTLNVEVIGFSAEICLRNPKNTQILILNPLKIPKLLAQYPKKYRFH